MGFPELLPVAQMVSLSKVGVGGKSIRVFCRCTCLTSTLSPKCRILTTMLLDALLLQVPYNPRWVQIIFISTSALVSPFTFTVTSIVEYIYIYINTQYTHLYMYIHT